MMTSGSDHYPITISYDTANPLHATPSWKLRTANWDHFSEYASMQLGTGSSSISAEDFSEKLIDIAEYTIPKSKPSVRKRTPYGLMTNVRRHAAIERKLCKK